MIKVLVPGSPLVIQCGYCGSTLSYDPSDVQQGRGSTYNPPMSFWRYIRCPQCTHEVRLPDGP